MVNSVRVLVLTHIPSPYQVELFNAVAECSHVSLSVAYIYASSNNRLWQKSSLRHDSIILNDEEKNYAAVKTLIKSVDLVIFNYYQNPLIMKLIEHCANSRKAWCFWGERTGYHQLGWLGTYYRKWRLSVLHQSSVPIWGIGSWAVEQYRREFGDRRQYFNVPYFSDLKRFNLPKQTDDYLRKFLYSGSLVNRKGVDLLAQAFSRLADELPFVKLNIVGEGNLRPWLEKKLAKYKERVQFGGFQHWDALPQFYQCADILCAPSRYDGWALVIPEGLAAGLPVISTNRMGATWELIQDRRNGWVIPAGDKKSLYEVMKQASLLSSTELIARSNAAKKSVSQHTLADGVDKFLSAVEGSLGVWR